MSIDDETKHLLNFTTGSMWFSLVVVIISAAVMIWMIVNLDPHYALLLFPVGYIFFGFSAVAFTSWYTRKQVRKVIEREHTTN